MNRYELLTIFSSSLNDEQKESAVAKYTKMIEEANGKIHVVNKWGVKKFAYPIDYKREGYYVLFEFESDSDLPSKITESMRIDESAMRHMFIKKN